MTEVVIVATLMALVMTAVVSTGSSMNHAYSTAEAVSSGEARARRAIERVVDILEMVDRDSLTPRAMAPLSNSTIDFIPGEGLAGSGVKWGNTGRIELRRNPADPDDGVDNDGNGIVDDGRVVWVRDLGLSTMKELVLCTQVSEFLEGEEPDGLDQNENGLIDERGFCIEVDGNRLVVRLTVEIRGPQGMRVLRTLTRTIALRMGSG